MMEGKQEELERLAVEVAEHPGGPAFPLLADIHRRAGQLEAARSVAAAGLAHSPGNVLGRVVLGLALIELNDTASARTELEAVVSALTNSDSAPVAAMGSASSVPVAPSSAILSIDALADDEISRALDAAETDREQMRDANSVAQEAMRLDDLASPELAMELEDAGGSETLDSPEFRVFATETMAALAEDQGDATAAAAIREAIPPARVDSSAAAYAQPNADSTAVDPGLMDAAKLDDEVGGPFQAPRLQRSGSAGSLEAAREDPTDSYSPAERERIVSTLEGWLQRIRRGTA
jgi:hypothetical protein